MHFQALLLNIIPLSPFLEQRCRIIARRRARRVCAELAHNVGRQISLGNSAMNHHRWGSLTTVDPAAAAISPAGRRRCSPSRGYGTAAMLFRGGSPRAHRNPPGHTVCPSRLQRACLLVIVSAGSPASSEPLVECGSGRLCAAARATLLLASLLYCNTRHAKILCISSNFYIL